MKRISLLISILILLSLACSLVIPAAETHIEPPTTPVESAVAPAETTSPEITAAADTSSPVLLFTIGMHIEPFGQTAQGYFSGKGTDYRNNTFYQRHVQDIQTVTTMVEQHGGRMTIQTQSPFTSITLDSGNRLLADLSMTGHEIALHFHEDAHLGKHSETLSAQIWCETMIEEIALIKQTSGVVNIRYWSGGNLYPDLYDSAACAGLDVNSDWKNPRLQETDLSLVGIHPWRPAGGTDGLDFSLFAQYDPYGQVVFLPEGLFDQSNFASMRRSETAGGDEAYFDYLASQLAASLEAAETDKVNVFHFTIHAGEFHGDMAHPFAVIEDFLTEVVDPLVASGQIQWASFSDMADAYIAWESANPGVAPK